MPPKALSVSVVIFGNHMALGRELVKVLADETAAYKKAEIVWLSPQSDTDTAARQKNSTQNFFRKKELFQGLNGIASQSTNDILLFFSDLVSPKAAVEALAVLPGMLAASKVDALSPLVFSPGVDTPLYAGETYAEAVFYGYFRNEEGFEKKPVSKKKQKIATVDTVAPDCFAVRRTAFEKVGGFNVEQFPQHFAMLDLCLRLPSCGLAQGLRVDLADVPCRPGPAFGAELQALIRLHGQRFARAEDTMQRGLLCPAKEGTYFQKDTPTVLLVAHELSLTGAPTVLLDMAIELREMGWQVLFTACKDGPLAKRVLAEGFPLLIDTAWEVGRYLTETQQDYGTPILLDNIITDFDKTLFCSAVLSNLVVRYSGGPAAIYWWIHETLPFWAMDFVPQKLAANIKLLAGGPYVKDVMKRLAPGFHPEIMSYGVRDRAAGYQPEPNKDGIVRFIMPSAIQSRKGHDVALEAIRRLPLEVIRKIKVLFVGSPIDMKMYKDLRAFCSVWSCAEYLENVDRDELFALYKKQDVILCPSRDDPMPVILAEAMMFRKLFICSDHTGTSYYLKDGYNAFIIPNEDSEALADRMKKIVEMYGTSELENIAERGRKVFEQEFASTVFTSKLKKYFPT